MTDKDQSQYSAQVSEIFILTFDPTPGVKGVCKDRLRACMVLYAQLLIPF